VIKFDPLVLQKLTEVYNGAAWLSNSMVQKFSSCSAGQNIPSFLQCELSLPCSQKCVTRLYPKPLQYISQLYTIFAYYPL